MNKGIEDIKGAIYTYKKQREDAADRIEYIASTYGAEAGNKERELQAKKLAPYRASAEYAIKTAYDSGVNAANQWGKLDGSKITDDAKLLEAGLVSREDFEVLKKRYSDNHTMLLALKKYGDKQNEAGRQEREKSGTLPLDEGYNVRDIPTLQEKLDNWEKAKNTAYNMLDLIDKAGDPQKPGDWGTSFQLAALPDQLEHFGEGADF